MRMRGPEFVVQFLFPPVSAGRTKPQLGKCELLLDIRSRRIAQAGRLACIEQWSRRRRRC